MGIGHGVNPATTLVLSVSAASPLGRRPPGQ